MFFSRWCLILDWSAICNTSHVVLSEAVDGCICFSRKIQHGGDWQRSRPQGPKNVHNFLMTSEWACGYGTEMLLILKKTIFDLITPRYFPIYTVQRNVPRICTRSICGWNLFQPLRLMWHPLITRICVTPLRGTYHTTTQQSQNICITCVQCRTNVEDVGPTLYKYYANVLCLLGNCRWIDILYTSINTKNFCSCQATQLAEDSTFSMLDWEINK